MSSEDSSSVMHLLLLLFPSVETLLLLAILLSGLNKVDFYHMIFLIFFVGYLVAPKRKEKITYMVIIYSFSFIIIKQMYTLLNLDLISKNEDFFEAMGIAT